MAKIKNTVIKSVILLVFVCLCSAAAFAEEEYVCSNITYTNAAGETVTGVSPGVLNAAMTVKAPEGKAPESMAFIMILYNEGKITDASIDEKTVGAEETSFSGSVIVPEESENCYVNTVLWDSIGGMTPVCNASLMPGGGSGAVELKVDGTALEGFDSDVYEYEYTVSAKRRTAPEVDVTTLDSGAAVEITNPVSFPGETAVKVTSVDGEEKTYTIKYKCEEPLIENVRLIPKFTSNTPTPVLEHNLNIGSRMVVDRAFTAAEVLDEFIGCDYIPGALGWGNDAETFDYVVKWKNPDYSDWLSFDLNRSATVYVLCSAATEPMNDPVYGYERVSDGGITSDDGKIYNIRYKKHVEVGDEPVTVSSPNIAHARGYIHVIVYDGYAE